MLHLSLLENLNGSLSINNMHENFHKIYSQSRNVYIRFN